MLLSTVFVFLHQNCRYSLLLLTVLRFRGSKLPVFHALIDSFLSQIFQSVGNPCSYRQICVFEDQNCSYSMLLSTVSFPKSSKLPLFHALIDSFLSQIIKSVGITRAYRQFCVFEDQNCRYSLLLLTVLRFRGSKLPVFHALIDSFLSQNIKSALDHLYQKSR